MPIRISIRAALPLLPAAAALLALAVVGLAVPAWIDPWMTPAGLVPAVLAVGAPCTVVLAAAAVRSRARIRAGWAATALACALWTASLVLALARPQAELSWLALRAGAALAAAGAVLALPGPRRSAREWGLLLLDGWLVSISAFLIGYVVLGLTGSPLGTGSASRPTLPWVAADLVLASGVAGIAARDGTRTGSCGVLIGLAALLTVTSDTTWALTVHPQFGVLEWLIVLLALGSATFTGRLERRASRGRGRSGRRSSGGGSGRGSGSRPPAEPPRLTRLAQLALLPGLLAAAVPGADLVTFAAAASLVLVLAVELLLIRQHHHQLWRALQRQAEQLEELVRESRDAILRVDVRGRVEFASEAAQDVFGQGPDALLGGSWLDLVSPQDRAGLTAELVRLDRGEAAAVRVAARFRHADGGWRHLESTASRRATAGGYTLSVRDVTERSRLEAQLRRLASTDALTGLFNRSAFVTVLAERLPRGEASVLYLDLDGFKAVNDTLGHDAGDKLLRSVADALRAELRPGDIAARLGGDEFAVLPAVRGEQGSRALAARLVDRLSALPAPRGLRITASIGVATARHTTAELLLRRADRAMYQAKAVGGGAFTVFAPEPPARGREPRVSSPAPG